MISHQLWKGIRLAYYQMDIILRNHQYYQYLKNHCPSHQCQRNRNQQVS